MLAIKRSEMKRTILREQSKVVIPTKHGNFLMSAFSHDHKDRMPHLVLSHGDREHWDVANVRIHSECITGDLFGSLRCECGEQLNSSLEYIKANEGLLIYLRQEGRGIGIINKLKAYVEQDKGMDTAQANEHLGFGLDDRNYDVAIQILNYYGINRINLLTNNPEKIAAFDDSNIAVVNRLPLEIEPNETNYKYLHTKKEVFGHLLEQV
jgi:GTP cyclohydrolase II